WQGDALPTALQPHRVERAPGGSRTRCLRLTMAALDQGELQGRACHGRESNPHWTGFEPAASTIGLPRRSGRRIRTCTAASKEQRPTVSRTLNVGAREVRPARSRPRPGPALYSPEAVTLLGAPRTVDGSRTRYSTLEEWRVTVDTPTA